MFWNCPKCGGRVDFQEQMSELFDENKEAYFDPEKGVYFHSIICECCDSGWIVTISERGEFK